MGSESVEHYTIPGDNHGGGDAVICRELAETMLHGAPFPSGGIEGLNSAVVALSIEEARKIGAVFDLEPVWRSLNRPPADLPDRPPCI